LYRNISYRTDSEFNGEIILYTWDHEGKPITEIHPHRSHLFVEHPKGRDTSMFGTKLVKMMFDSSWDRYRWIKNNPSTRIFESLPPEREFLLNYYQGQQESPDFVKHDLRVQFIDLEISVDSEFPTPDQAKYPINLITVHDSVLNEYNVFVLRKDAWSPKGELKLPKKKDRKFHIFEKEADLLKAFSEWMHQNPADVISGWNTEAFDIPYIVNRMSKLLSSKYVKMLSPLGEVKKKTRTPRGSNTEITTYDIKGISSLDYYLLYRYKFKSNEKKSSYKLGNVTEEELGITKLSHEGMTFKEFYTKDFNRFILYNIVDVELLVKLDKKLNFIKATRTICNLGLCEYQAIFNSSPYITGALALQARADGTILLSDSGTEHESEAFSGGFVFKPELKAYFGGVASLDLNSLYPNIMINLNISPETKIGKIVDRDEAMKEVTIKLVSGKTKTLSEEQFEKLRGKCTVSPNGILFINPNKKVGIIPKFLQRTYDSRRIAKDGMLANSVKIEKIESMLKQYTSSTANSSEKLKIAKLKEHKIKLEKEVLAGDLLQKSKKLLMNSLFGQLGSKYFCLCDFDLAQAITSAGQKIILESSKYLNELVKKDYDHELKHEATTYADTDSVVGNSMIETSIGNFCIEDLYNLCSKLKINNDLSVYGHEILNISGKNIQTWTSDGKKIWYDKINKIVRHKVSKGKFKIKAINGYEVIMTKDHGASVIRNNELIKITPLNINSSDQLVVYTNNTEKDFEIIDIESVKYLGEFEDEYVYDLEMDSEPHTFFANGILVHNSCYFDASPIVKHLFNKNPEKIKWTKKKVEMICDYLDNEIVPKVNKNCYRITNREFMSPLKNIEFKRETFCDSAVFCSPKRYLLHALNVEGVHKSGDKCWKPVGIDIRKSELPVKIKGSLKHIIFNGMLEKWDRDKYSFEIGKVWDVFCNLSPNDLALYKGYNTEKSSVGFLAVEKGAGAIPKASHFYNDMLKELNITHKYEEIRPGDLIRLANISPINKYNLKVIGWKDEFPEEFEDLFSIDRITMFEKVVLKPLKKFIEVFGWPKNHPSDEEDVDLLSL